MQAWTTNIDVGGEVWKISKQKRHWFGTVPVPGLWSMEIQTVRFWINNYGIETLPNYLRNSTPEIFSIKKSLCNQLRSARRPIVATSNSWRPKIN